MEVPLVDFRELSANAPNGEKSAIIRERAVLARGIQTERFRKSNNSTNAATRRPNPDASRSWTSSAFEPNNRISSRPENPGTHQMTDAQRSGLMTSRKANFLKSVSAV